MADGDVEVTVEVDADPGDGVESAPAVTVVDTGGAAGTDGEVVRLLTELGERLAVVEARLPAVEVAVADASITAEIALDESARVAAETEEAVAELAEEAEAATPEVVAEVEDIAPDREHPWFAKRSVFGRKGDE